MTDTDNTQKETAPSEPLEWYYELRGSRIGPVAAATITSLLVEGTLTKTTLVWKSGFGPEWRPLDATELFCLDETTPPPLPPSHINELYARGLVALPLIGAALEGILGNVFSRVPDVLIFGFYFAANSILSIIDSKQISESGRNPNNLRLGFWFWIIPVYLYQRAAILGQRQLYLAGWIIAFVAGALLSSPELRSGNIYWGFGVPSCSSGFTANNVKNIFGSLEAAKLRGIYAIDISQQKETARETKKNLCTATVRASDGREYPIVYTIELEGEQIFILVNFR